MADPRELEQLEEFDKLLYDELLRTRGQEEADKFVQEALYPYTPPVQEPVAQPEGSFLPGMKPTPPGATPVLKPDITERQRTITRTVLPEDLDALQRQAYEVGLEAALREGYPAERSMTVQGIPVIGRREEFAQQFEEQTPRPLATGIEDITEYERAKEDYIQQQLQDVTTAEQIALEEVYGRKSPRAAREAGFAGGISAVAPAEVSLGREPERAEEMSLLQVAEAALRPQVVTPGADVRRAREQARALANPIRAEIQDYAETLGFDDPEIAISTSAKDYFGRLRDMREEELRGKILEERRAQGISPNLPLTDKEQQAIKDAAISSTREAIRQVYPRQDVAFGNLNRILLRDEELGGERFDREVYGEILSDFIDNALTLRATPETRRELVELGLIPDPDAVTETQLATVLRDVGGATRLILNPVFNALDAMDISTVSPVGLFLGARVPTEQEPSPFQMLEAGYGTRAPDLTADSEGIASWVADSLKEVLVETASGRGLGNDVVALKSMEPIAQDYAEPLFVAGTVAEMLIPLTAPLKVMEYAGEAGRALSRGGKLVRTQADELIRKAGLAPGAGTELIRRGVAGTGYVGEVAGEGIEFISSPISNIYNRAVVGKKEFELNSALKGVTDPANQSLVDVLGEDVAMDLILSTSSAKAQAADLLSDVSTALIAVREAANKVLPQVFEAQRTRMFSPSMRNVASEVTNVLKNQPKALSIATKLMKQGEALQMKGLDEFLAYVDDIQDALMEQSSLFKKATEQGNIALQRAERELATPSPTHYANVKQAIQSQFIEDLGELGLYDDFVMLTDDVVVNKNWLKQNLKPMRDEIRDALDAEFVGDSGYKIDGERFRNYANSIGLTPALINIPHSTKLMLVRGNDAFLSSEEYGKLVKQLTESYAFRNSSLAARLTKQGVLAEKAAVPLARRTMLETTALGKAIMGAKELVNKITPTAVKRFAAKSYDDIRIAANPNTIPSNVTAAEKRVLTKFNQDIDNINGAIERNIIPVFSKVSKNASPANRMSETVSYLFSYFYNTPRPSFLGILSKTSEELTADINGFRLLGTSNPRGMYGTLLTIVNREARLSVGSSVFDNTLKKVIAEIQTELGMARLDFNVETAITIAKRLKVRIPETVDNADSIVEAMIKYVQTSERDGKVAAAIRDNFRAGDIYLNPTSIVTKLSRRLGTFGGANEIYRETVFDLIYEYAAKLYKDGGASTLDDILQPKIPSTEFGLRLAGERRTEDLTFLQKLYVEISKDNDLYYLVDEFGRSLASYVSAHADELKISSSNVIDIIDTLTMQLGGDYAGARILLTPASQNFVRQIANMAADNPASVINSVNKNIEILNNQGTGTKIVKNMAAAFKGSWVQGQLAGKFIPNFVYQIGNGVSQALITYVTAPRYTATSAIQSLKSLGGMTTYKDIRIAAINQPNAQATIGVFRTPVGYTNAEVLDMFTQYNLGTSQAGVFLTEQIVADIRSAANGMSQLVEQKGIKGAGEMLQRAADDVFWPVQTVLGKEGARTAGRIATGLETSPASRWAAEMDISVREKIFLKALSEGESPDTAARLAREAQLNYGDMNPIFKKYIGAGLLYLSFTYQTMKEMLRALMTPGGALRVSALAQMHTSVSNAFPEFKGSDEQILTSMLALPAPFSKEGATAANTYFSDPWVGSLNMMSGPIANISASVMGDKPYSSLIPTPFDFFTYINENSYNPTLQYYETMRDFDYKKPVPAKTALQLYYLENAMGTPFFTKRYDIEIVPEEKRISTRATFDGYQYRFKSQEGYRKFYQDLTFLTGLGITRNMNDLTGASIAAGLTPPGTEFGYITQPDIWQTYGGILPKPYVSGALYLFAGERAVRPPETIDKGQRALQPNKRDLQEYIRQNSLKK